MLKKEVVHDDCVCLMWGWGGGGVTVDRHARRRKKVMMC